MQLEIPNSPMTVAEVAAVCSAKPSNTVVIIATKGRPQLVSNLLDVLAMQTALPDRIIISATDGSDILDCNVERGRVEVLFGAPGLVAQRNRALSSVRGKCDIIIFFDDDFVPSRFWIERVQKLLTTQRDIVCVTGEVLRDGVTSGGLEWSVGKSVVDKADLSKKSLAMNDYKIKEDVLPYGCNMAYRANVIEQLRFDERLIIYGWLEDRDFAFRIGTWGRIIWTNAIWGVHLGSTRERTDGVRFGYSQVVNPWYLLLKGSVKPGHACRNILRALFANAVGHCLLEGRVDRLGRLRGNLIGVRDIVTNRWAPEKIAEL